MRTLAWKLENHANMGHFRNTPAIVKGKYERMPTLVVGRWKT